MRRLEEIARPGAPEWEVLERIDLRRLPRHVAVIMDGNGRWAKARRRPRVEGHRAGIQSVREVIEISARLDIETLTLYAFSTENWKRPRYEVVTLMALLKEYLRKELDTFLENNLRFRTIGRTDQLEASVRRELDRALEATSRCTGPLIQIALNYSGRQEIRDLVRDVAARAARGELDPEQIGEGWIGRHLDTGGVPDPDLLIRTSGERRISNFMLWQLAYTEIYFTPVLWPDFRKIHFLEALLDYQQRERRFGGLSPEETELVAPAGDVRAGT